MSNKVFVLAPNESWIVDRFVKEWNKDNDDISVTDPNKADVLWLYADWTWERIKHLAHGKKIVTTVHHIVPEKFGSAERFNFQLRDDITTVYHVTNKYTHDFIRPLTKKPIETISYWANNKIWRPTGVRGDLRKKHGLSADAYLIGSFVRDTEGAGIPQGTFLPKLEKGPDLLADAIITLKQKSKEYFDIEVVLAGWRRQYIMKRLDDAGIKYKYFDLPNQEIINELYQTLDLYPVTARVEGGPQSLIECGLLYVPVISRPIGIAYQVLPETAINDDVTLAVPAVPIIEHLKLPNGYDPYRKLFESL
jgi:glycosyltransferase involved in cell wall biosynthesis